MFEQQSEFKIEMEIAVRHVTMPSLARFLPARDGAEGFSGKGAYILLRHQPVTVDTVFSDYSHPQNQAVGNGLGLVP
jgi:hypothetical protein